jgi:hypothetical protein
MGARIQGLMGGGEEGEIQLMRARKILTRTWGTLILLAATLAVLTGTAFAQSNPFMPKMSLGGQEKKALTPEEQERQKQLDAAYRAATNKIPNQTANDPWVTVRPAPAAPAPKKKPH